jgi:hypothetical protein
VLTERCGPLIEGWIDSVRKAIAPAIAIFWFVANAAASEYPLLDVGVDQFVYLKGEVLQSVQSGADFWLRVNITPGDYGTWRDTIVVTYRAVSPLQERIREKTVVGFQKWHRGRTSYKTVLGATLELPLVNACLLWDENDTLRFAPPKGCGW